MLSDYPAEGLYQLTIPLCVRGLVYNDILVHVIIWWLLFPQNCRLQDVRDYVSFAHSHRRSVNTGLMDGFMSLPGVGGRSEWDPFVFTLPGPASLILALGWVSIPRVAGTLGETLEVLEDLILTSESWPPPQSMLSPAVSSRSPMCQSYKGLGEWTFVWCLCSLPSLCLHTSGDRKLILPDWLLSTSDN